MPGARDGCGRACCRSGARTTPGAARPGALRLALKRLAPLLVIAAVMGLVFAMGWHREVTLENIVALRDQFHHVLAEHRALALVLAYVARLHLRGAPSPCPAVSILTADGRTAVRLAASAASAAVVGGDARRHRPVPDRPQRRSGEIAVPRAYRAPGSTKLRAGFKEDALSYLLFLRLVPAFPFWFVNIAPAILGVPLKTYVIATFFGIIPATFAFAVAGAGLDSVIAAAKAEHAPCVAAAGRRRPARSPSMRARSSPGSCCWLRRCSASSR